MPLLGFKRQFAGFVKEGSKQHTIRAKRKIRPKVGQTAHCYVDPRQKSMTLLGRWPITHVHDAILRPRGADQIQIWINGEELTIAEAQEFLYHDGFRSHGRKGAMAEAAEFWRKRFEKVGGVFYSDIVHWKWS